MGFGHRVYKRYDPRANILREMCKQVLEQLAHNDDPFYELALRLEGIALKDQYFVERNLYPNVDFYPGIIYRALRIPNNRFTAMFAIARTVGRVSHWLEMMGDRRQKIGRPRQLYTGVSTRDYVPIDERKIHWLWERKNGRMSALLPECAMDGADRVSATPAVVTGAHSAWRTSTVNTRIQ